jgi:hypothetical protein
MTSWLVRMRAPPSLLADSTFINHLSVLSKMQMRIIEIKFLDARKAKGRRKVDGGGLCADLRGRVTCLIGRALLAHFEVAFALNCALKSQIP